MHHRKMKKKKSLKSETVFGEAETPIKDMAHYYRFGIFWNRRIAQPSHTQSFVGMYSIWAINSCAITNIWHRFESQFKRISCGDTPYCLCNAIDAIDNVQYRPKITKTICFMVICCRISTLAHAIWCFHYILSWNPIL